MKFGTFGMNAQVGSGLGSRNDPYDFSTSTGKGIDFNKALGAKYQGMEDSREIERGALAARQDQNDIDRMRYNQMYDWKTNPALQPNRLGNSLTMNQLGLGTQGQAPTLHEQMKSGAFSKPPTHSNPTGGASNTQIQRDGSSYSAKPATETAMNYNDYFNQHQQDPFNTDWSTSTTQYPV